MKWICTDICHSAMKLGNVHYWTITSNKREAINFRDNKIYKLNNKYYLIVIDNVPTNPDFELTTIDSFWNIIKDLVYIYNGVYIKFCKSSLHPNFVDAILLDSLKISKVKGYNLLHCWFYLEQSSNEEWNKKFKEVLSNITSRE